MTPCRARKRALLAAAALAALAGLVAAPPLAAAQSTDQSADRGGATVPVPAADAHDIVLYRDGPAEVTEARPLALPDGARRLVADGLPETAADDSLSAALVPSESAAAILPEAVTLQAAETQAHGLLARLVGQEITWLVPNPSAGPGEPAERAITGILRAAGAGEPVVERDGGLEVLPPGRLRLDSIPADLALNRSATVDIEAPPGTSTLFLRYTAGGLAWDARYAVEVAHDGVSVRFSGDYLIVNTSREDYESARLRLVAGDVPRIARPHPVQKEAMQPMAYRTMSAADSGGGPPSVAAVGERQIFSVSRPVTLAGNSTVRRPLFKSVTLPAERHYRLTGQGEAWIGRAPDESERLRPRVEVTFVNDADGPLARPLPAGEVSVRAPDDVALSTLLLAEARMPATAVGERVALDLGEAFDVGARRRLASFEWRGEPDERTGRRPYTARHEIVLTNAKKTPVTVDILDRFNGEWEVTDSSHPVTRADARTASFEVEVPAGGETTFTYTVRAGG